MAWLGFLLLLLPVLLEDPLNASILPLGRGVYNVYGAYNPI